MKLSEEQLERIENKLYTDYDFYYDDAKYEVIDHIASEIENEMQNISFETALEQVFSKWEHSLQETEWSGMHFYGKIKMPLFYKKRLQQSFRNDLFLWICVSVSLPLFLYVLQDTMEIETINTTVFIYKIAVFAIAVFLNKYTLEKYQNGEYTTVYGQIAAFANKKNLVGLVILAFYLIYMQRSALTYREQSFNLFLGNIVFFNLFYFMFIIKYCNYFRHLKMIKSINRWKAA